MVVMVARSGSNGSHEAALRPAVSADAPRRARITSLRRPMASAGYAATLRSNSPVGRLTSRSEAVSVQPIGEQSSRDRSTAGPRFGSARRRAGGSSWSWVWVPVVGDSHMSAPNEGTFWAAIDTEAASGIEALAGSRFARVRSSTRHPPAFAAEGEPARSSRSSSPDIPSPRRRRIASSVAHDPRVGPGDGLDDRVMLERLRTRSARERRPVAGPLAVEGRGMRELSTGMLLGLDPRLGSVRRSISWSVPRLAHWRRRSSSTAERSKAACSSTPT